MSTFPLSVPRLLCCLESKPAQLADSPAIQSHLHLQVTMSQEQKPPFPPFTQETAQIKVKAAQDVWNTKYVCPSNLLAALTN